MKDDKNSAIKIIPIGGLGGIGNNMTVLEYQNEIIIIDCGIRFPSDDTLGIDFIIPDFTYIIENKHKVKGIILTHGHEDHIGAIPFLLQEITAPLYATKLTLSLVKSRLEERPPRDKPTLIEIAPREHIEISNYKIEFLRVNHSIIDGVGLAIETDVGIIIHSGDFKIDFSPVDGLVTDIFRFASYGEKGVLLLMSDSTNAEIKGHTKSETILSKKFINIFSSSKSRIIVASFASNFHRIQQVMDAAYRYNRKVVLSGITMQKNVEIAKKLNCLTFKDELIIDFKDATKLPDKKLVIICTGSQGEPMSALSRMAKGTHKHFSITKGDTVIITASIIPGNEKMVTYVINSLLRLQADVYYEQDEDIHVSGHAHQEELKLMISLTKPKYFMPIHGEYKHLTAHAKIAKSLNIKPSKIMVAENGDILDLSKKTFKKIDALKLSQIFVDGKEIGDIENGLIRDRQIMSSEGIFFITILLSNGNLIGKPKIITKGSVGEKNYKSISSVIQSIEDQTNKLLMDGISLSDITMIIKKNLKKILYNLTRNNPLIEIQIIQVQ